MDRPVEIAHEDLGEKLLQHRRFLETSGSRGRFLDLTSFRIVGFDFGVRDLTEVVFYRTVLQECRIAGCDLSHAVFSSAVLDRCDLRGCRMIKAEAFDASFLSCRFDAADLTRFLGVGCAFAGSTFSEARLVAALFRSGSPDASALEALEPAHCEGMQVLDEERRDR